MIFLTVMLSAYGKQPEETLDGQTEKFILAEQREAPEMAEDEDVTGKREPKESSLASGERMAIQEVSNSMANDITFDFESKTVMLNIRKSIPLAGDMLYNRVCLWKTISGGMCVLNPSEETFEALRPYIQEAYEYAKEKFAKRKW